MVIPWHWGDLLTSSSSHPWFREMTLDSLQGQMGCLQPRTGLDTTSRSFGCLRPPLYCLPCADLDLLALLTSEPHSLPSPLPPTLEFV